MSLLLPYAGISMNTQKLFDLVALYGDYKSAKKDVDYVINNPSQYYMKITDWQSTLNRLATEAQNAIQAVATTLQVALQILEPAPCRPRDFDHLTRFVASFRQGIQLYARSRM